MDPNKAYDIGRQGDEQRFRSLIQDALSEGNEAVASWLINKVKAAHEGSFKDIIEEAVTNANTEDEKYKPTNLAKKYWNEYFPEAEQQGIAAPENLKEGDHITDANGTEHVVLGHKNGSLILETMDGKRSEVPYPVIEKELAGGTASISSTNITIPKEDDHFGEEQAEGLSNLLEGLRDTPHDNRW